MTTREMLLTEAFVELADSLVDDFDIIDLLTSLTTRCVELLGADAAGVLLLDAGGVLHVTAASNEEVRLLELFQLQNEEGPCFDCFHSGAPVVDGDLTSDARWPRFAPQARAAGFESVHAFPMRLRDTMIGALNLFKAERAPMEPADRIITQGLADVATIAVLQHQAAEQAAEVVSQLHNALNSRIAIEQAKGMLAERAGIGMDESFARLRQHARSHNAKLSELAASLVEGTLTAEELSALITPANR